MGGSGLIWRIRGEVVEVYTQDQTFPTRWGTTTCLEEDEDGFFGSAPRPVWLDLIPSGSGLRHLKGRRRL